MPRAMWNGAVSFGLVTIPVKMYGAVSPKDVAFHQVDKKSGARVRHKRVSAKTGREVDYDDIVKGYEIGDDHYVTIEPEELDAIAPEATHMIEIEDFVDIAEVDPIYFEKPYYLAPDRGGDKAYALLVRAMRESGLVALGRVVIRSKERLAALRPYQDKVLAVETMQFPDEIVDPASIDAVPDKLARVGDQELKMAKKLIESMTIEFDPDRYQDTYRGRVLKMIRDKSKGKTIVIEEEAQETSKVVDLMEALKASVERGDEKKQKQARKRSRAS